MTGTTMEALDALGAEYVDVIRSMGWRAADRNAPYRALQGYFGPRCPSGRFADMDPGQRVEAAGFLRRINIQIRATRSSIRPDLGSMSEELIRDLPDSAAPALHALLTLLEREGHSVDRCRRELQRLTHWASVGAYW